MLRLKSLRTNSMIGGGLGIFCLASLCSALQCGDWRVEDLVNDPRVKRLDCQLLFRRKLA